MKRNVEVPPQIRAAFEAKRDWCVRIARERTGQAIPMFRLVFSQMGQRAGVCATTFLTGESTIKINPDFFKTPKGYEEQLNDTTPHEIAHAVVDFLYPLVRPTDGLSQLTALMTRQGRRQRTVPPHGRDWERVMKWFGISNPRARHTMDMTGVVVRQKVERPFNYLCNCKGKVHTLSSILHRRIQEQNRQRRCRICGQRIVFERQWGKTVKPPTVALEVAQMTPKAVVVVPPTPLPPATHRTVTRFVNGALQNVRIPLTPEETAVLSTV